MTPTRTSHAEALAAALAGHLLGLGYRARVGLSGVSVCASAWDCPPGQPLYVDFLATHVELYHVALEVAVSTFDYSNPGLVGRVVELLEELRELRR